MLFVFSFVVCSVHVFCFVYFFMIFSFHCCLGLLVVLLIFVFFLVGDCSLPYCSFCLECVSSFFCLFPFGLLLFTFYFFFISALLLFFFFLSYSSSLYRFFFFYFAPTDHFPLSFHAPRPTSLSLTLLLCLPIQYAVCLLLLP